MRRLIRTSDGSFAMGDENMSHESHAMALSAQLAKMSAADSRDMLLTGFLVDGSHSEQSSSVVASNAEAVNCTVHTVSSQGSEDVPPESHAMALSARLARMSAADSRDMLLTGFLVDSSPSEQSALGCL